MGSKYLIRDFRLRLRELPANPALCIPVWIERCYCSRASMSISANAMSTLLPSRNEVRCASSVGDVLMFYEKYLGEMCEKCRQNIATEWVQSGEMGAFPLLQPIGLFFAFGSLRVIFFCLFHCDSWLKRLYHLRDAHWIHLLVRCKQLSGEPLSCWLVSELLPCGSVIPLPLLAL